MPIRSAAFRPKKGYENGVSAWPEAAPYTHSLPKTGVDVMILRPFHFLTVHHIGGMPVEVAVTEKM
ncbi:hypothetical protein [Streptomyces griseoluteus]|uniref:hypothetical protein n=1 Tax=Streptomyces griseoluteus TaxID=29306 RepID=UPI00367FCC32